MSGLEVLVDTNVATWTWLASAKRSERARQELLRFGDDLTGKTLVICGQTRAELLQLKLTRDPSRAEDLQALIDAIPYVPLNKAVQHRYAELKLWAKNNAHPIHQPTHSADRWIAASAMHFGMPLASCDGIFVGLPQIELIGPADEEAA